jgi:hypothetical protein
MIIELPNYLSIDEVKKIKESVKPYIQTNRPTTYNRDGNTVCISKIDALKDLDNKLHNIFLNIQTNVVASRYKPSYKSGDSGYEYHIYNPGEICHYHGDGEFDSDGFIRYASVIIHLSTIKEGGELIFPSQNKIIKTEAGKVVIFPPYTMFGHYTTPSNEPREVLVSWFIYTNKRVIDYAI